MPKLTFYKSVRASRAAWNKFNTIFKVISLLPWIVLGKQFCPAENRWYIFGTLLEVDNVLHFPFLLPVNSDWVGSYLSFFHNSVVWWWPKTRMWNKEWTHFIERRSLHTTTQPIFNPDHMVTYWTHDPGKAITAGGHMHSICGKYAWLQGCASPLCWTKATCGQWTLGTISAEEVM